MARKINKLRVAEAGLFELEDKIRALGGDPDQVRRAVDSRAAERLRRYSNPDQPPTPS